MVSNVYVQMSAGVQTISEGEGGIPARRQYIRWVPVCGSQKLDRPGATIGFTRVLVAIEDPENHLVNVGKEDGFRQTSQLGTPDAEDKFEK
ncbi:hypothetical protein T265_08329 [Opisthorchis viverrini]|uniref:Uncharacterized protein n=1 Tax=Opisthorchis viverrini TaxID=6198 RepID=A0A074ZKM5_OPIVI|nr:hypothetical protein T265_08329 [Opisthorchis viverrini]KER23910.1 hypothetical protein T265_08329 [Opisthorchis viverrini]